MQYFDLEIALLFSVVYGVTGDYIQYTGDCTPNNRILGNSDSVTRYACDRRALSEAA